MSPSTKVGPEVFGITGSPLLCLGGIGIIAGVEAVRVLQIDHADVAQHPLPHHCGHLVDQRVAGEAICDPYDNAPVFGQGRDLLALLHGEEERLLADDVKAGFKASFGDLVVSEVRCRDGDNLNPVGRAFPFLGNQGLVVRIKPVLGDPEVHAKILSALKVEVEGAADHLIGRIVAQRAGAVLVADLARAPPPTIPQRRGRSISFSPLSILVILTCALGRPSY